MTLIVALALAKLLREYDTRLTDEEIERLDDLEYWVPITKDTYTAEEFDRLIGPALIGMLEMGDEEPA